VGKELCVSPCRQPTGESDRKHAQHDPKRNIRVYAVGSITAVFNNDFNYAQLSISTKSIRLSINSLGERMVTKKGEKFDITFPNPWQKESFLSLLKSVQAEIDREDDEQDKGAGSN